MLKGKCDACGATLEITYAKNGTMVQFCPHIEAHVKKSGVGAKKHLEIYCVHRSSAPNATSPSASNAVYMHEKDAKSAAKLDGLRLAFKQLTRGSGLTEQQLKDATRNTVSEARLLENANLALMLDIPTEELPSLFSNAMRLGYAMGITTEKAIESLCKGIGRQTKLILDNIGVSFNPSEAYAWYKEREGLAKVTDAHKRLAWKYYAIKLVKQKGERLATSSTKRKLEQLYTRLTNAKARFGEKVLAQ